MESGLYKRLKKQEDYENLEFKVLFSNHIEVELNTHSQRIQADIPALLYREEQGFFQYLLNKSLVKKLDTHIRIPGDAIFHYEKSQKKIKYKNISGGLINRKGNWRMLTIHFYAITLQELL